MNSIFVLSLTGSCMTAGYYMLCLLMGNAFSHRMRYLWLKLSLVSFLLPLWRLRDRYVRFLRTRWNVQLIDLSFFDNYNHEKILFQYNDKVVGLSWGLQKELLFTLIWVAIALAILAFCLVKFYRSCRMIRKKGEVIRDGAMMAQLARAKKDYGIHRKVKLFLMEESRNFSSSLIFPFVVMRKENGLPEYVLKHELMHVKRGDSLFRVFLTLAVCIHWFNPFIYLLKRQMEEECELSCDDRVMGNCSMEERAAYARLLVSHAQKEEKQVPLTLYWKNSKKIVARRVDNIMEKKEKNRKKTLACLCLMAVFLFGSSFTVLAYDNVYIVEKGSARKVGVVKGAGCFNAEGEENVFAPEIPQLLYDEQFIDNMGNIYDLTGDVQMRSNCLIHQYVPGQYMVHEPELGGGCNVHIYYADRCSNCKVMRVGDYLSTMHYAKCIH